MSQQQQQPITLDKNNPDSIFNWIAFKITSPAFRNLIKDFIDDNCSLFIDVDENTFQQGQLFNEFQQLIENLLNDLLVEGGITQEQFLAAAERGLEDKKYKKYFDQILNFSDYNYFKNLMTKRNYQLIKRVEEQMAKKQKEAEKKKQEELERQLKIENQKKGNKKTNREIEEEKQRILTNQLLHKEEEEELQKAIQQSLEIEDEKRKMQIIEEEELNRAIKQSLLDSKSNTKVENTEKEKPIPKKEEKKPEPKKEEFKIENNNTFNFESKEKPNITTPLIKNTKNAINMISNNTNLQFTGYEPKEEKPKPTNIISASKGFDFQIEGKKKEFGISEPTNIKNNKASEFKIDSKKNDFGFSAPTNLSNNNNKIPNPYARPAPTPSPTPNVKIENTHIEQQLIDDEPKNDKKEKKDYSPTLINIENKNKNEKKDEKNNEIKKESKKDNKKSFNLLQFEDNTKEENIVVTKEIKREKASDIIKNTLNENKIENRNDDDGGLLIDDDEEDVNKTNAKTNTFIDKKKDINLGKIRLGKEGGNFLNNFSGMKNYEKGGMEKMENKIKESKIKSVLDNENDDDDFKQKLREVENEKQAKLKEYREYLLKMKKEKRENKAKEVLSPEELAKLESKKRLAEQLKAKRK